MTTCLAISTNISINKSGWQNSDLGFTPVITSPKKSRNACPLRCPISVVKDIDNGCGDDDDDDSDDNSYDKIACECCCC